MHEKPLKWIEQTMAGGGDLRTWREGDGTYRAALVWRRDGRLAAVAASSTLLGALQELEAMIERGAVQTSAS